MGLQSLYLSKVILLALLIAIPNLSGSLLRIPFAAWVDINGGRKPFITLLVLSIIGMTGLYIIMAFFRQNLSQYYSLLLIFGALSGCGIAIFSIGVSQESYWFPQSKQGIALGIYGGAAGWVGGLGAFGGFVIPPVRASFIDKTGANLSGFSKGFLVFSALTIMSLIILGIFRMGSKNSAATSKA
jgi:MFS transporter, NNP family, nitrate/nitrite transporter